MTTWFKNLLPIFIFVLTLMSSTIGLSLTTDELVDIASTQPDTQFVIQAAQARFHIEAPSTVSQIIKICPLNNGRDGEFRFKGSPTLCLREGLSIAKSLILIAHELTHGAFLFSKFDPKWTKDDFIKARMHSKGGEIEAYSNQVRMMKYTRSLNLTQDRFILEKFYSEDGNLIDEPGLETFILENLGYRSALSDEYEKLMKNYFEKQGFLPSK